MLTEAYGSGSWVFCLIQRRTCLPADPHRQPPRPVAGPERRDDSRPRLGSASGCRAERARAGDGPQYRGPRVEPHGPHPVRPAPPRPPARRWRPPEPRRAGLPRPAHPRALRQLVTEGRGGRRQSADRVRIASGRREAPVAGRRADDPQHRVLGDVERSPHPAVRVDDDHP